MEQITKEIIAEFIRKNEIELKSTHKTLCLPIIHRLYKKMRHNLRFSCIYVCDGAIIDGHHRYVASLLAGFKLDSSLSYKTSATEITDWKSVSFVEEDWDTPEKIEKLNREDADYNAIPIEKIRELLQ